MAMQKRERILAIVAGGLLVAAVGQYLFGLVHAEFTARSARLESLKKEIGDKELLVARGKRAGNQLKDWERRSLPSNPDLAKSLYQNWLMGLVDREHFANANVGTASVTPRKGVFHVLRFSIQGQGKIDQVTRFLHAFYSADHLHQITRFKLTPVGAVTASKETMLDMELSIEAAVLPGAVQSRELNTSKADRLAYGELDNYTKTIVERHLFAAYSPPPVVAENKPPPAFDSAQHAFVTGVTRGGGRALVWLNVRTTGQLFQLHEGQTFKVGELEGTIAKITPQAVEIQAEGKRRLVPVGKSLRDGREVPAEGS